MPDPNDYQNVFNGILQVLQRIEAKLETHETHVRLVEDLIRRNKSGSIESSEDSSRSLDDSTSLPWQRYNGHGQVIESTAREQNPTGNGSIDTRNLTKGGFEGFSVYSKGGLRIKYGEWRSEYCSYDPTDLLEQSHFSLLQQYLGHCAVTPDDGRLPLNFSWTVNAAAPGPPKLVDNLAEIRRLEALRTFDSDLKEQRGNDFLVVDVDSSNNSRLYRVGQEAIGSELMVSAEATRDAPWSRLILYQGMTTGDSIKREFDSGFADPIPYFRRADANTGLWNHIFSHLQLKRRNVTSNPYTTGHQGFHTTFYDIRETKDLETKEIYCPLPLDDDGATERNFEMTQPHWTMLVLAPGGFFNEHNTAFPMKSLPKGRAQALGHCLGRLTRVGAELNLIGQGLARISERWADFQSFFDYILDSGDSLMQPHEHDNLLFDDGAFSRSRRYFWAIDCLSEFENAITDNINQWELYKAALPTLMNDLDNIQYRNTERQCRVLQNQREYFRQKLASTRALRDALFNASAVIESRASTRLGENVKLLTFVSVFFIPLSFCTSLWSINTLFSTSSLIAVIIIVALLTYTTVLNINSIVHTVSLFYDTKKRRIVAAMKGDRKESWRVCGRRFESFRPKHENPKPSEWFVGVYAVLHLGSVLGLRRGGEGGVAAAASSATAAAGPKDGNGDGDPPARFFGVPNRFWKRKKGGGQGREVVEPPDEAWVFD
ncbi:MAG: hypothetical protein Q9220_004329 [cf. Caloplaca sp. 1 TL-2023]